MFKHPIYLVPVDFTSVSKDAANLALELAKTNEGSAYLLNIVSKESQKIKARQEMSEFVEEFEKEYGDLITTNIISGNIFEDIGKSGDILKASIIVMGTHGAKGMQKVYKSHAVKIIQNSHVPLLITQGEKQLNKIENIVFPFSYARETMQIATFAANLAKQFNAKMHLVGFDASDELLDKKTNTNQIVISKHLNELGIESEIVHLEAKGKGSYEKELLAYAEKVDADILAAAFFKEGVLPTPNSFIQHMIENKLHIPVLTVNADELSTVRSQYSFITV